jgi:hypothetical protein
MATFVDNTSQVVRKMTNIRIVDRVAANTGADVFASAACRDWSPHLFFSQDPKDLELARLVCKGCVVVAPCRKMALGSSEVSGTWGGLSEAERIGVTNVSFPRAYNPITKQATIDQVLNALDMLHASETRLVRYRRVQELQASGVMPSAAVINKLFGSWIVAKRFWMLRRMTKYCQDHPAGIVQSEADAQLMNHETLRRYFGSANHGWWLAGSANVRFKPTRSKKELLKDYRTLCSRHKRLLGYNHLRYLSLNGECAAPSTYRAHFESFSLLAAAAFPDGPPWNPAERLPVKPPRISNPTLF